MSLKAGIFGYPLGHSLSPVFQQAAFDFMEIDAGYELWEIPPKKFGGAISALKSDEYLGANVTIPYKEVVGQYLDNIDPMAESIGAVNTVVKDHGQLTGYNTDAFGFIESLKLESNFDLINKNVVLIGSGGAARAAAFGMVKEGIRSLVIANRTLSRAALLANDLSNMLTNVEPIPLYSTEIQAKCSIADLIVNTTSMGMLHSTSYDQSPVPANFIPNNCLVYDIVYNPKETPLLTAAHQAGARTLSGLPMLIYQGSAAFNLWTSKTAPVDIMFQAATKALKSQST